MASGPIGSSCTFKADYSGAGPSFLHHRDSREPLSAQAAMSRSESPSRSANNTWLAFFQSSFTRCSVQGPLGSPLFSYQRTRPGLENPLAITSVSLFVNPVVFVPDDVVVVGLSEFGPVVLTLWFQLVPLVHGSPGSQRHDDVKVPVVVDVRRLSMPSRSGSPSASKSPARMVRVSPTSISMGCFVHSVCRAKARCSGRCKSCPGKGRPDRVAIPAAMEVTKWSKPGRQL